MQAPISSATVCEWLTAETYPRRGWSLLKATEVLRCRELTRCANRDRTPAQQNPCLLDHLVGAAEERQRESDAEGIGGLVPQARALD
jgi:hypothetical protein